MDFRGKKVVVTGAASGIGKRAALGMGLRGADVAIVDINEEGARKVAGEIGEAGGNTMVLTTDLSKPSEIKEMVDKVVSGLGRIDAQANVAAIYPGSEIADVSEEYWDMMMAMDLRGVFFTTQAVMSVMIEQGGGSIVNVASGAAFKPIRGQVVYSAAKGGIVAMNRVFALEGARKGVRVNVVAPGPTASETMLATQSREWMDAYAASMVPGRMMDPAEVGDAIVFLCSDAARGISGAIINVNGGDYMPSG